MVWLLSIRSALGAAITFISKPPGSWIAAALGLVLCLWLIHHHGYKQGVSACETRHAEAAANELKRQKDVFIDADKRSTARTTESEKKNTENKTRIVYVKEKAAAMADHDATCIPADIADRLREIN